MMTRAALGLTAAGLLVAAAPVAGQYSLYYGNFHSHCNLSDDAEGPLSGPPDVAFAYARDVADIDILALTDHTHYMSATEYNTLQAEANNYTQNGVFVALAGQEHGSLSTEREGAFGHLNVWESLSLIPQYANGGDDYRYNLLGTYTWVNNRNDDTIGLPLTGSFNHPYSSGGTGIWAQFHDFAYDSVGDRAMQLIELINGKRSAAYEPEFFEALGKGWHVGVLGNQDNHQGMWGDQPNNVGNIPLTGVWATALTKGDVLEALRERRTYAMEVEPATDRISMEFRADGNWMGSDYSTAADSILFEVIVSAETNISTLSLYRNGTLIRTAGVASPSFTWNTYDTPGPGDFWYYVRLDQSDGDRAWTSPIWVESTSSFSLPLATVNEDDANGLPLLWFQNATVQGLVTVDTDTLSTVDNLFFIQDPTGGLMIQETGSQSLTVEIGDNVLVTGLINSFEGQTFLEPTSLEILSQGGGEPLPTVISTNDLATAGETWEGELVEVRDVAITGGSWPAPGFDGSVTIDDGSGPATLYLDKDTVHDDNGAPAESLFCVRGVLVQRDPSFPYLSNHGILPRFGDDIFQLEGVGVTELPSHEAATRTRLHQNWPNPFRPSTVVRFDLAAAGETPVRLEIFDVEGRRVRTLLDAKLPPGEFEARWDGRGDRGEAVAAGVYFYRLVTPESAETRKMVRLK
jgi:hypothetical protein